MEWRRPLLVYREDLRGLLLNKKDHSLEMGLWAIRIIKGFTRRPVASDVPVCMVA